MGGLCRREGGARAFQNCIQGPFSQAYPAVAVNSDFINEGVSKT